jgi:2-oxoglutarate ferredoxin oxidoreductase subunit gamma
MQLTIRLAGYGGYGVVTAARLLGLAFTLQDYHVVQTESHGAAARGGACTADVIVSSSPIYDLSFSQPDILVLLSLSAFQKCCGAGLTPSRKQLLIESSLLDDPEVKGMLDRIGPGGMPRVYPLAVRQIAEALGHVRYIGVASLGALAAANKELSLVRLTAVIESDDKLKRFVEQNLEALDRGARLVNSH